MCCTTARGFTQLPCEKLTADDRQGLVRRGASARARDHDRYRPGRRALPAVFGAARRFGIATSWRRDLLRSPPALERRAIAVAIRSRTKRWQAKAVLLHHSKIVRHLGVMGQDRPSRVN